MENNEWLYSELLELLKKKEKEKDDLLYQPIELELPIQPDEYVIGDEQVKGKEEENKNRGIVIIEF